MADALRWASYSLLFFLLIPIIDLHFVVWLFDTPPALALPFVIWVNVAVWGVLGRIQGEVIDAQSQAAYVFMWRAVAFPLLTAQTWAITWLTGI